MNDDRPPTPKPPEPGSGQKPEVCPTPEELAAYLAGGLTPEDRERVEDHASRCDDCHFVLRETALFEGEQETLPKLVPKSARPRLATYLMPLAAAVIVGLGSMVFWRQAHPADRYARSIEPLVEAVGPRRFIEARLTGGFRYGPLVGHKRGPASADPEQWPLFAAAEKIRAANEKSPTADSQRALAAAHLVLGETGPAVEMLERLAREAPGNAGLLNDLAAAYLTRALEGHDEDYPRAFESASRAVEMNPKLAEAWFNRALAANALGLPREADESRRHLHELEASFGWSGSLSERKGSSIEPTAPTQPRISKASLASVSSPRAATPVGGDRVVTVPPVVTGRAQEI